MNGRGTGCKWTDRVVPFALMLLVSGSSCGSRRNLAGSVDTGASRLTVQSAGTYIADGSSAAAISVRVVDLTGSPVSGAVVNLGVTGQNNALPAGPLVTGTDGWVQANLSSTTAETKMVTATVSLVGLNYSLVDQLVLDFMPDSGHPSSSSSTVLASPATGVLADGVSSSSVTVTLVDGFGNSLSGLNVSFSAPGASVAPSAGVTDSNGELTAQVVSTASGIKNITATVSPAGGGPQVQLVDQPTIEFVANPATFDPINSPAVPSPATGVLADGVTSSALSVTLVDGLGNPLPGLTVSLSVPGATAVPAGGVTDSNGQVTAQVVSTVAGVKTVTVQVTPPGGGPQVQLSTQPTIEFVANPATIDATNSAVVASPTTGLPADGVAATTVTVTVEDAFGNPVPGQQVQVNATGTGNAVTQPASLTDANGQATAALTSTTPEAKVISAVVNPGASQVDVTQTAAVTFEITINLDVDDAVAVYGEASPSTIRSQEWDDSAGTWSGETAVAVSTATLLWAEPRVSGGIDPAQITATLTDSGAATSLEVLRFDGTNWLSQWTTPAIPTAQAAKRGFDLRFEQSSSELLVVYTDGSATPLFRTWDGANWSAPLPLPLNDGGGPNPDPNTGAVEWIELASRPGTDEIALSYSDANLDLVTLVWDGANWVAGSVQTLETNLSVKPSTGDQSHRVFDLAYESVTGDLVVCWGRSGSTGFVFDRKAVGGNVWDGAVLQTSALITTPHFLDVAPEPGSDRIALVNMDVHGLDRMGHATWNGTAWVDVGENDSNVVNLGDNAVGDFPGAVGWVGSSGVALCVYGDNATGTRDWATWTAVAGWVIQVDGMIPGNSSLESVRIETFGAQNKAMVMLLTAKSHLFGLTYDGTSWTGAVQLESLTSRIAAMPFGLAIR